FGGGGGGSTGTSVGIGGWRGGAGGTGSSAVAGGFVGNGGGGAGFGGAIFLRTGSLALNGDQFAGNSAVGGISTNSGQGKGGALFVYQDSTAVSVGSTFTGSVAAQAGIAGI